MKLRPSNAKDSRILRLFDERLQVQDPRRAFDALGEESLDPAIG